MFDLRLDGELDRETFDTKRNEIQLKINRLKSKIAAHEKADDSFNMTLLELLDIATEAGSLFIRSTNIELKRMLIRLVFKHLVLTERNLSYELNFPFELFETTKPKKGRLNATELVKSKQNKALEQIDSKNEQIANSNSHELQIPYKKQEVRRKNLTSVQSGWGGWIRTNECRHQKPMPYHLATPQHYSKKCPHKRTKVLLY